MSNSLRKIIYSISVCSEKKYQDLFSDSNNKPGQQAQKYHRLLIDGLSTNRAIDVEVISKLPITRNNYKCLFLKSDFEKVGNVNFWYIPILNIPIIKNLISFFSILYYVLKKSSSKNTVIIGDILNITTSIANLVAGKLKGIKTVGIVTDIPSFLVSGDKNNLTKLNRLRNTVISNFNEYILQKFDSYVFLTEQMNTLINKRNKPYIVMEGHVDINMAGITNRLQDKYDKKVCMYTGSLKKLYGIKMLTQAFIDAKIENSELHIYGDGDFKEELIKICKENKNIKYFGVKLNDYIVNEQLKASLLINPRPTNEEYTKYSFPSKNMEYMASGTPTLTTKLPGMPKEYNDYVYLISDESVGGIAKTLTEVLSLPKTELHQKGLIAKQFVLERKNNIVQASKILELINRMNN